MNQKFPISLAAIIHFITWLAFPVVPLNDSNCYIYLTQFVGNNSPVDMFSPAGQVAKQWDRLYPSGYVWFLDFLGFIAPQGLWQAFVVFSQHALAVFCVWVLMQIGQLLGRPKVGWWAACFFAISSAPVYYAQSIMSETLFYSLYLTGLWRLTKLLSDPEVLAKPFLQAREVALIGLLFGLSAMTRPIGLAFVVVIVAAMLLMQKQEIIRRVQWILGAAFVFLLVYVVHTVYIYNRFNQTGLTTNVGRHLANRIITNSPNLSPTMPAIKNLIERVEKSEIPYRLPGPWWTYWRAFREGNPEQGAADADKELGQLVGDVWPFVLTDYVFSIPSLAINNIFLEDMWITYPESVMPYDQLMVPEEFEKYVQYWLTPPEKEGFIPKGEYDARKISYEHMQFRPPLMTFKAAQAVYIFFKGAADWRSWLAVGLLLWGIGISLWLRDPVPSAFALTGLALIFAPTLSEWQAPRFYSAVTPVVVFMISYAVFDLLERGKKWIS